MSTTSRGGAIVRDEARAGNHIARALALCVLVLLAAAPAACGGGDEAPSSSRPTGKAPGVIPGGTAPAPRPVPALADVTGGTPAPLAVPDARTDYPVPPFASLAARFRYDRDSPLDLLIRGETKDTGATVFDVSYMGAGHRVRAWLVLPAVQRPVPAVLYAHSYGGSRDEFLGEAMNQLAPRGVAGLVIDTPQNLWSFDAVEDWRAWVSLVTDLRRGLDLLETLPQIDARRLGFVGYRQGADAGAILSGIDDRVRAYALISCATYLNRASQFDGPGVARLKGRDLQRFLKHMFALSPELYVAHSRGAAFLFMNSRTDAAYPIPDAKALHAAAPAPKRLRWHTAGRYLDAASYAFQSEWLVRRL